MQETCATSLAGGRDAGPDSSPAMSLGFGCSVLGHPVPPSPGLQARSAVDFGCLDGGVTSRCRFPFIPDLEKVCREELKAEEERLRRDLDLVREQPNHSKRTPRHCEHSEAIHTAAPRSRLLRCARNDEGA